MATSIIEALREAVAASGGTPASFTKIGLLRELITIWGGTPTARDTIRLLREAVTAVGGTPTEWTEIDLLVELIAAMGGASETAFTISLYGQLSTLSPGSLDELTLNTSTIAEGSANGTVVGTIQGRTALSTLSLSDSAGGRFAINSGTGQITVANTSLIDWETATSHSITVLETLAPNVPRSTILSVTVTNALEVTLNALALSQNTFNEDASATSVVGNLLNTTTGSTLTLIDDGGARFIVDSDNRQIVFDGGALDFETEPTIDIEVRETLTDASPRDTILTINVGDAAEGDVTAPTLSGASGSESGPTTASLSVTTNEANGTLYWVVTTSSTAPSAAQVKAGQNNGGTAAVDSGSATVSSTGAKVASADGLTASTNYWAHFMHEDVATNQSAVASSAMFTTDAAGVPSNTLEPVVSGTPAQTMTLSVTNGAWSNSPSSYTYAWYTNSVADTVGASLLVGEVAATLLVDPAHLGLYIFATVAATNGSGSSSPVASNVVGPVLEQPLPTTNATLSSAVGADPEVDIENVTAGWTLHIQRDETGGDYSSTTLDITHLITEHEETTGAILNSSLTPDGYSSPSGAGIQRYRYETDDGRTGPWSEISYNVTSSVNALATTDGVNRSQHITGTTTPRLDFCLEINVGSVALVRGLTEIPGKVHVEMRIDGWYSGTDDGVYLAVVDSGSVTSLATTLASFPGIGTIPGCIMRIAEAGTQIGTSANGASTAHNLGVTAAVGDYLIMEIDPTAKTIAMYYWDASAGALVNGGSPLVTKTLTSLIPADWHIAVGGRRGTATVSTSDSGTLNCGATAFIMTPNTGFNGW